MSWRQGSYLEVTWVMSLGCRIRQVVTVYVEKVELWHFPGFWTGHTQTKYSKTARERHSVVHKRSRSVCSLQKCFITGYAVILRKDEWYSYCEMKVHQFMERIWMEMSNLDFFYYPKSRDYSLYGSQDANY